MPNLDSYTLEAFKLDGLSPMEHNIGLSEIYRLQYNGVPQTYSSTPVERMAVSLNYIGGKVRINYSIWSEGGVIGNARVYLNNYPIGPVRTTSGPSSTFTEDITFDAGDKISIYIWVSTAGSNRVFLSQASIFSNFITIIREGGYGLN
ncbi:hypothetical protein HNR77_004358 [Paenibacillus sp. JGP012]|uniref:hypothetical protein n=1 Tax=Paenibacillus sp. JGP012 TaxID=2735914 RepID=UPI00161420D2|nr:hypothetical protein [Paenibacillus sp. JGP012]MBB6023258.1 hypothetical protein [Paenibacillus sp. JGP012]